MLILLLIASIPSINSNSCNSFPKIFGGNDGDTYLLQIDVYNDYLAMIGHSYDSLLKNFITDDFLPYILL
jgi:hypothetical protein